MGFLGGLGKALMPMGKSALIGPGLKAAGGAIKGAFGGMGGGGGGAAPAPMPAAPAGGPSAAPGMGAIKNMGMAPAPGMGQGIVAQTGGNLTKAPGLAGLAQQAMSAGGPGLAKPRPDVLQGPRSIGSKGRSMRGGRR